MVKIDRITLDPAVMGASPVCVAFVSRSALCLDCSLRDIQNQRSSRLTHTWKRKISTNALPMRRGVYRNEKYRWQLYEPDSNPDRHEPFSQLGWSVHRTRLANSSLGFHRRSIRQRSRNHGLGEIQWLHHFYTRPWFRDYSRLDSWIWTQRIPDSRTGCAPKSPGPIVLATFKQHEQDLASGAIVVVDEFKSRVRILPI